MKRKVTKQPHTFYVYRMEDISGVSGTGLVAEGIQFTNGKVAVTWRTEVNSVTVYDSMLDAMKIHGHGGYTKFIWIENTSRWNMEKQNFDPDMDPIPASNKWITTLELYEPGEFRPSNQDQA